MAGQAGRLKRTAGVAILAVVAIGALALAVLSLDVGQVAAATRTEDVSAPDSLSADNLVRVAVIGDSYTGGSDEGGYGAENWTVKAAAALTDEGLPVAMSVGAAGGTGYVVETAEAGPFGSRTGDVLDAGTDVVVVFGSRNDGPVADQVGEAAVALYADIARRAPNATLLVVGAPWVDANVPGAIVQIRDQLAREAAAAGGEFLDPIADRWFFGPDSALIGSDDVHPTDEGHTYMAERILEPLRPLVEEAADSGDGRTN